MKLETGLILQVVLGVVHTYQGIFESATFSFRIQKFLAHTYRIQIEFPCPHARMVSGCTVEKLGLCAVPPYWFIVR